MKPTYENPNGNVPAKRFLQLAHQHIAPSILRKLDSTPTDVELITGGTSKRAVGKDSSTRTTTTKAESAKPSATTTPPATTRRSATKQDAVSKPTSTTNAPGGTKTKPNPVVKRADGPTVPTKVQPPPVVKKVTYVDIDSEESSGEEDEGEQDEESGEESDEVEEVEAPAPKPSRRKGVKSPAVITDEMDEAAGGVDKIKWSAAEKKQAQKDAEWSGPDRRDPCFMDGRDLRYGPLYWGPYNTPLAKPGPIAKEDLPDRDLNPVDREGHAKYMLADLYDIPCRHCTYRTVAKSCVATRSKPHPLGATEKEERESVIACAYCRHQKRRCEDHSRGRSRQIVLNPFHDPLTVAKGGSGKVKVKKEGKVTPAKEAKVSPAEAKATPAVKTRGSRRPPAVNEVPDGDGEC